MVCLCAITFSNLLECWLCENVNLVLLWISRMLGIRWHNMKVFFEKNIELNKCGKVNFLQSWAKQWSYCTVIATLSCNRWTAIGFALAPKMTGQTKKFYFDPWLDLSVFSYLTPWMLKANIWVVSLNIFCVTCF